MNLVCWRNDAFVEMKFDRVEQRDGRSEAYSILYPPIVNEKDAAAEHESPLA